ncbi:MAG TPA: response regulator [Synechococcales cyanobacterium M55_K2018_004]|nr:response regulator [Synechococcales cyanobacterium M55_K2018_004]
MTTFLAPSIVPDPPTSDQQFSLRVLVAEDNPVVQKTLVQMLTCLRHQARGVSNGVEVLDALQQQQFDIVLMDVQMPLMNGLQATQKIRQGWPQHSQPHIVAMTGRTSDEEQQQCVEAGMDLCLTKPIPMQVLVNTLKRLPPLKRELQPVPVEATVTAIATEPMDTVLDQDVLAEIRTVAGDSADAFLIATIDDYLEELPKLLQAMRGAIAQQSLSQLREATHTLRITSSFLGALKFAQQCSQVENWLASADLFPSEAVNHALTRLEMEALRVQQALQVVQQQAVGASQLGSQTV